MVRTCCIKNISTLNNSTDDVTSTLSIAETLTATKVALTSTGTLSVAAIAALATCAVGLVALARLIIRFRGTTYVAPLVWGAASLITLAATETIIATSDHAPDWNAGLRFFATMGTFCPMMALLGAKRPQDRGWQFIALSLWVILSLPSFEWLLFGGVAEIHAARCYFLVILMGVGALNGVAIRYWPSSLLYCFGQIALIAPYFAELGNAMETPWPLVGIMLIAGSWLLLALGWPQASKATRPLDRLWLDFRDTFGVVWGLRIMERMNASATMYDWPVTLGWTGFQPRASATMTETPAAVEESLRSLLRRFVSPEWIEMRLNEFSPKTSGAAAD